MITRFANLTSRLAVVFVTLCTIAACGGGGGGGDGGFLPDDGPNSSTLFLALLMLDAKGNPTDTVTSTAPVTLQVKVTKKNKNGAPVPGVVVNTSADIGQVFPGSGTALSDDSGIATFQIEAGADKGAGLITSTAQSDTGQPTTSSLTFQIGNSGLRLGYFDADGDFIENEIAIQPQATLASAGRAQLALAIVNENGELASTAEDVRLSSGCLASGQATLDPPSPLVSGDGMVATTYTAAGCSGTDEISASIVGASAQAFGNVTIASPQATGVTFVSAEPNTIVLKGTGGGTERQDSSDVVFRVVDSNGSPVQGVNVNFSLTTDVGGTKVTPESALSASDGTVGATVFSGDVATVVRVIASTDAPEQVATVSDILTISTGLPDQNSISLSVGDGGFVVENGFTVDGTARTITVRMADKFNNPVPNGTAAVFTTEYGAIDPSCQTGIKNGERQGGIPVEGECSVKWTNQEPRSPILQENRDAVRTIYSPGYDCPSHNGNSGPCPDDLGYTRGGRSTILVTAIGEESFVDTNGNGVMDQSEQDLFDNVPEAFLDNNEDNKYTPADPACSGSGANSSRCRAGSEELFTDFNSNGDYDLNDNPAVYNGLLCPLDGDGVWCSRELVNVRDDAVLILSADPEWDIILVSGSSVVGGTAEGNTYSAYISDIFNSLPPSGSTVAVEAEGACTLLSPASFEIPNTSFPGAFGITVETAGDGGNGTVSIKLTPKNGGAPYSETFGCTSIAPPDPNAP